jgi:hypothetical protein
VVEKLDWKGLRPETPPNYYEKITSFPEGSKYISTTNKSHIIMLKLTSSCGTEIQSINEAESTLSQ